MFTNVTIKDSCYLSGEQFVIGQRKRKKEQSKQQIRKNKEKTTKTKMESRIFRVYEHAER